jgi:hypothetical protein
MEASLYLCWSNTNASVFLELRVREVAHLGSNFAGTVLPGRS